MLRLATVDDASAIGHVHVESWRSTYRGLMPDAVLDKLLVEQRTNFWRKVLEQDKPQSMFAVTGQHNNVVIMSSVLSMGVWNVNATRFIRLSFTRFTS